MGAEEKPVPMAKTTGNTCQGGYCARELPSHGATAWWKTNENKFQRHQRSHQAGSQGLT